MRSKAACSPRSAESSEFSAAMPAAQQLETNVPYPYDRPDQKALTELEHVVHSLAEELAGWRRRTLKAEGELQEARANGGIVAGPELTQSRQRVAELETENQTLRQRIDAAKERLRVLSGRLSFLEQHGGGNAA